MYFLSVVVVVVVMIRGSTSIKLASTRAGRFGLFYYDNGNVSLILIVEKKIIKNIR